MSVPETPYRSIVKDGYSTNDPTDNAVEVAAWRIETVAPGPEPPDDEERIKTEAGNLLYSKILDTALDELGAEELSRRTGLKSYRDERGGRAESTIKGYRYSDEWTPPKEQGGFGSSHPIKRVLRRYARSRDIGHFRDDKARDDEEIQLGPVIGAEPIDIEEIEAMFRLARLIASKHGLVFVGDGPVPRAEEDNERIDHDEIRGVDRPIGETKAGVHVVKADGSTFEYEIDLDQQTMTRADGYEPPEGW